MDESRTILSETWQPEGFILRVERVGSPDFGVVAMSEGAATAEAAGELQNVLNSAPAFFEMESCYTLDGSYIGDIETARLICGERGIKPERVNDSHNVCSIGFCEAEQKWYGWSHRAMCGFGVGSTVKRGDVAYVPSDWEDARNDAVRFWTDEHHVKTEAFDSVDADGRKCFRVEWTYADTVPNAKLRGMIGGTTHYPPEALGRGEWTAVTLDDARQMAADFAESIG